MSAFQSVSGLTSNLSQTASSSNTTTVASSSTGYTSKSDKNQHSAEFNYIREHGFTAYVKEIEEQKIKELREQMLQSMGLDEEKLAAMPADERAAIEDAISKRIQQQLDVATIAKQSNNDEDKSSTQKLDQNMAQMSLDPKMFTALTMMQELDQQSKTLTDDQSGDAGKSFKDTH